VAQSASGLGADCCGVLHSAVLPAPQLPLEGAEVDASQFDGATDFGTGVGNLRVRTCTGPTRRATHLASTQPRATSPQAAQLIAHEGEVNRARFMPQEPAVIATKTIRRAHTPTKAYTTALLHASVQLTRLSLLQRRGARV
jgi:hypothetical protein